MWRTSIKSPLSGPGSDREIIRVLSKQLYLGKDDTPHFAPFRASNSSFEGTVVTGLVDLVEWRRDSPVQEFPQVHRNCQTLETLPRVELESKIDRVAGRVFENPSASVTIDQLMRCTQRCRDSGSDREEFELCEGRCPLCHP